ncbi:MAG TPA: transglycosylase SLT domain-containing protein [Stellaceae bacterium]|nr:transglycosylase SLT domain-containing protein [Stellaceae bacterium]
MTAPSSPTPTAPMGADLGIIRDIRQASQTSHTDFGLLMAQAAQESGFRPDAKAATGSAAGLFQFVQSTWLDMMHRFGAKYGHPDLAKAITFNAAGKPVVGDPAMRQRILALRSDPALSAALAGEYANLNKDEVERALGHTVGRADLYMAHFLGPGGAATFLKALETNGSTPAAALLPEAAASNRAVFYDSDTGRARSVAEIYRSLGGRIEQEAQDFAADPALAAASPGANGTDPAMAAAAIPRPVNFAGLTLSQPVAAMLGTLTLAALKLVGGAPAQPHKPDSHA